jgi:hypothetical protein
MQQWFRDRWGLHARVQMAGVKLVRSMDPNLSDSNAKRASHDIGQFIRTMQSRGVRNINDYTGGFFIGLNSGKIRSATAAMLGKGALRTPEGKRVFSAMTAYQMWAPIAITSVVLPKLITGHYAWEKQNKGLPLGAIPIPSKKQAEKMGTVAKELSQINPTDHQINVSAANFYPFMAYGERALGLPELKEALDVPRTPGDSATLFKALDSGAKAAALNNVISLTNPGSEYAEALFGSHGLARVDPTTGEVVFGSTANKLASTPGERLKQQLVAPIVGSPMGNQTIGEKVLNSLGFYNSPGYDLSGQEKIVDNKRLSDFTKASVSLAVRKGLPFSEVKKLIEGESENFPAQMIAKNIKTAEKLFLYEKKMQHAKQ